MLSEIYGNYQYISKYRFHHDFGSDQNLKPTKAQISLMFNKQIGLDCAYCLQSMSYFTEQFLEWETRMLSDSEINWFGEIV
jgi:hypothetical protein